MPRTYPPRVLTERVQLTLTPDDRAKLDELVRRANEGAEEPITMNAVVRRLIRQAHTRKNPRRRRQGESATTAEE